MELYHEAMDSSLKSGAHWSIGEHVIVVSCDAKIAETAAPAYQRSQTELTLNLTAVPGPEIAPDVDRGLSLEQVEASRLRHGFNESLEHKVLFAGGCHSAVLFLRAKQVHPIWKFLQKFNGPTSWMLEAVIVLALALQNWMNAGMVAGLLVLNSVLSFTQDMRAARAVDVLKQRLQIMVCLLLDFHLLRTYMCYSDATGACAPGGQVDARALAGDRAWRYRSVSNLRDCAHGLELLAAV
jgi:hypothetical protein